ncbi:hypothetical protein A7982_12374 [Minicystis rosea]|nr:hypothetical protein A7982_12374 [Minicystis rosea]
MPTKVTDARFAEVEKRYKVTLSPEVRALYEKADGERAGSKPWRLQSTAELLEMDLDEGWLDHAQEAPFLKSLGGLLPLYTNDGSDLLVLHVGGPLDGRLSLLLHDDPSITLAFRSVETFLKKRRANAFADGELEGFDYDYQEPKPAKGAAKRADEEAAAALEKAFEAFADREGAAELVTTAAAVLRGEAPEDAAAAAMPPLWPYKQFIDTMVFAQGNLFASVALSSAIEEWSFATGAAAPPIPTPGERKVAAAFVVASDEQALLMAAKGALWRFPITGGKRTRSKVFDLLPTSGRIGAHLPDGRVLVIDETQSKLQVWSEKGELTKEINSKLDVVEALVVSADGKLVFARAYSEPSLMRIDLERGKSTVFAATKKDTTLSAATLTPDEQHLVLGSYEGAMQVLEVSGGKPVTTIAAAHGGSITGIVVTRKGVIVSVSEFDDTIRTFSASGEPLSRIDLERPARVAVDPNDRIYVAFAYRGIGRYDVDDAGVLQPVK